MEGEGAEPSLEESDLPGSRETLRWRLGPEHDCPPFLRGESDQVGAFPYIMELYDTVGRHYLPISDWESQFSGREAYENARKPIDESDFYSAFLVAPRLQDLIGRSAHYTASRWLEQHPESSAGESIAQHGLAGPFGAHITLAREILSNNDWRVCFFSHYRMGRWASYLQPDGSGLDALLNDPWDVIEGFGEESPPPKELGAFEGQGLNDKPELHPPRRLLNSWMERFPWPESLDDDEFYLWVRSLDRTAQQKLMHDLARWELARVKATRARQRPQVEEARVSEVPPQ